MGGDVAKGMKVVIDTDPGTDDALALIKALKSPDLEILGLTTVGGNATLAHTTRNALRLLEHFGRSDIPVYRGAARPFKGKFKYAYYFHGPAGLTVRLPLPNMEPKPGRAPEFIVDAARSLPGKLVLIALGPLTNVARALQMEPRLNQWVKEIVIMGGAVEVSGNVTPHAEFNIYNDAEAANVVFSSAVSVTLIGLDVCNQVYVSQTDVPRITENSKSEKLANRLLTNWFKSHEESSRFHLCDPLAVVAVLRPELFTRKEATVAVEPSESDRIGKTSASYNSGNVRVALDVNADDAKAEIRDLLGSRDS